MRAAHHDLADLADPASRSRAVDHQQLRVLHAATQRQHLPRPVREVLGLFPRHPVERHGALGFRRAVEVDAAHPGGQLAEAGHVPARQRLADQDRPAQAGDHHQPRPPGGLWVRSWARDGVRCATLTRSRFIHSANRPAIPRSAGSGTTIAAPRKSGVKMSRWRGSWDSPESRENRSAGPSSSSRSKPAGSARAIRAARAHPWARRSSPR